MQIYDFFLKNDPEEPESKELIIYCTIDGIKKEFLLDTGAARSQLIFDELTSQFEIFGENKSSGVFDSQTEKLVKVPIFQWETMTIKDFPIVRTAESSKNRRNLLGMDLLSNFICSFEFSKNKIIFHNNCDDLEINRDYCCDSGQQPYINIEYSDRIVSGIWDTGASMTVFDLKIIENNPDMFEENGFSQGTDSTGATFTTPMYNLKPVTCGGHIFNTHKIAGVDFSFLNKELKYPINFILGYNFICQADWIFNFPSHKWDILSMNK